MYYLSKYTDNSLKVLGKSETKAKAVVISKELKGEICITELKTIKIDITKPVVKFLNI